MVECGRVPARISAQSFDSWVRSYFGAAPRGSTHSRKPVIAVVRQPVFSSGLKLVGGPRCLPRESDLGGAVRTDHKPDDGTCDCASPKPHLACFSRGREPSSRVFAVVFRQQLQLHRNHPTRRDGAAGCRSLRSWNGTPALIAAPVSSSTRFAVEIDQTSTSSSSSSWATHTAVASQLGQIPVRPTCAFPATRAGTSAGFTVGRQAAGRRPWWACRRAV